MRADPKVLSGVNRLWIRFFLLAVFATMYVRDHARVEFHKALDFDPTDYDREVYRITSEISRQVFPITLDLDNPALFAGFERLKRIADGIAEAKQRGGVVGHLRRFGLIANAGVTFARLFLIAPKRNALPHAIRLAPAW